MGGAASLDQAVQTLRIPTPKILSARTWAVAHLVVLLAPFSINVIDIQKVILVRLGALAPTGAKPVALKYEHVTASRGLITVASA